MNFGGGGQYGASMGSTVAVSIQRMDGGTPWGFRLQGGKDFRLPLSIKKVNRGSPSDGKVHPGDAILAINGVNTGDLTHTQAQQMIKTSGGNINLTVGKGHYRTMRPSGPVKFSPATAHGYGYQ